MVYDAAFDKACEGQEASAGCECLDSLDTKMKALHEKGPAPVPPMSKCLTEGMKQEADERQS